MFKVIEVQAESPDGWQQAAERLVVDANQTLRGIRRVRVDGFEAMLCEGAVITYRVTAKIEFELDS